MRFFVCEGDILREGDLRRFLRDVLDEVEQNLSFDCDEE